MKNWYSKIFLVLFLACTPLFAQSDCANTPNTGVPLSLALPVAHCQQWNVQLNNNFTAINTFAGGVVLLNPLVQQTITQPGSTALNVNALQLFGTVPNLQFGTVAGTPTGYLTEIAPGSYSFDATIAGDGLGLLAVSKVNAANGYLYNGGTGVTTGQCLVAGSDSNHTFTPQSCVNPASVFYQTVDANGTAQTQRSALNFNSSFALSDSASPSRTTVALANIGTAGTYASPSSITVNAFGQVSAVTAGGGTTPVQRTCNSNGCYRVEADGTVTEWVTGAYSNSAYDGTNVAIALPFTLPNAVQSVSVSTLTNAGGDLAEAAVFTVSSFTTSSVTVFNVHNSDHGGNSIAPSIVVIGY